MKLKNNKVEQQIMASSSSSCSASSTTTTTTVYSFKNPHLWVSVVGQILILGAYFRSRCGLFPVLLTSIALLLSSFIFLTKSKKKKTEDNIQESTLPSLPHNIEEELIKYKPTLLLNESNLITQNKELQQEKKEVVVVEEEVGKPGPGRTRIECYHLARPSLSESSESCPGRTSSSTEDQDFYGSDGSISDEESLFEIALPSGHYIGHHDQKGEQDPNKFKKMLPSHNLIAGSKFFKPQQYSLMELLAELNEEDNYIEIDISMGSIKCTRNIEVKV